jgi:hypothetical protein
LDVSSAELSLRRLCRECARDLWGEHEMKAEQMWGGTKEDRPIYRYIDVVFKDPSRLARNVELVELVINDKPRRSTWTALS